AVRRNAVRRNYGKRGAERVQPRPFESIVGRRGGGPAVEQVAHLREEAPLGVARGARARRGGGLAGHLRAIGAAERKQSVGHRNRTGCSERRRIAAWCVKKRRRKPGLSAGAHPAGRPSSPET